MKGKGIIKIFGLMMFFVMFIFVDKVSANDFSNTKFEDLTLVMLNDENYTKPSEDDVVIADCSDCTVSIANPINVKIPGKYTVTYTVKDASNNEVDSLVRYYYVVDSTPVLVNGDNVPNITPTVNSTNKNYNFTINGYGETEASSNAGLDLFIGNKQNAPLEITLRGLCGANADVPASAACTKDGKTITYSRVIVSEIRIGVHSRYDSATKKDTMYMDSTYSNIRTEFYNLESVGYWDNGYFSYTSSDSGYFARQLIITVLSNTFETQGIYYLSYYNVQGALTENHIDNIGVYINYENNDTEYKIGTVDTNNYVFQKIMYTDTNITTPVAVTNEENPVATAYGNFSYLYHRTLQGNETGATFCFFNLNFYISHHILYTVFFGCTYQCVI